MFSAWLGALRDPRAKARVAARAANRRPALRREQVEPSPGYQPRSQDGRRIEGV